MPGSRRPGTTRPPKMQDLGPSSFEPGPDPDPLQADRPRGHAVQQGSHRQPHGSVPQPPEHPPGNHREKCPPAPGIARPRGARRSLSQHIPEGRSQKGTSCRQTDLHRRLGPSRALLRPATRDQLNVGSVRLLSGPSALEHSGVLEHTPGIRSASCLGHPVESLARRSADVFTPLQESLRDFVHGVHVPRGRRSPPVVKATCLWLCRATGTRLRGPAVQE
mmetsp:Transcript_3228/g.7336  ORF Transcript_3228/g.7336 Transcript_3228/m.7336 type:complete len:220 (+) Transcript_3228:94-753(+)